jgi:hypothetical protein
LTFPQYSLAIHQLWYTRRMYQNIYIIISADIDNVMYWYIIMYSLLLSGIVFSAIIFSNQSAYAHTFSEDENALYLTMIHQVQAELQNVRNNMLDSNNLKSAIQHANLATELLGQNDPLINLTRTNQISERNPRVASELIFLH